MAAMALSVGFYAGLRPSEIAGLRWENVTEDKIYVKQAYVIGKSKGTKTGENRKVVMLPQLRNRMKVWAMRWKCPKEGQFMKFLLLISLDFPYFVTRARVRPPLASAIYFQ
jgi:integrase